VTFLGVLPEHSEPAKIRSAERELERLALDEGRGVGTAMVVQRDDVVAELVQRARECDLLILGLEKTNRARSIVGGSALEIAASVTCPLLMISQRV
jgi:nucleotide-binding universal stress UspA family protein